MAQMKTTKTPARKTMTMDMLSMNDLQAELRRRQKSVAQLQRRRQKLLVKLETIEQTIGGLGGGRRARNEKPLVQHLAEVLADKQMSVGEAMDAVIANGFKTGAANFRVMVNHALANGKNFKRMERGIYTAKKKSA